jgi:hypothetical protein
MKYVEPFCPVLIIQLSDRLGGWIMYWQTNEQDVWQTH